MELTGLLLAAALAAARWLASGWSVRLLERLLQAGDDACARLGLSACGSLCVPSCRRRAATAGQERPESLNIFKSVTLPSAVRMPRLPALARATANACTCPLRAITAR